jgi:predicted MFS family arabinose efflux permease
MTPTPKGIHADSAAALGGTSGFVVSIAGMLLIAATYGMARFGVGLYAPFLYAERPRLEGSLGWATAAQFISFCLAAALAGRRSPRTGLVLAGTTATLGAVGVAVASEPGFLVLAVFVGGMGGGFASPTLVPVIDALVAPGRAGAAQSLVNSGTAVGVMAAGLLAFLVPSTAPAWIIMAVACAMAMVAAWYPVRARRDLAMAGGRGAGGNSEDTMRERTRRGRRIPVVPVGAALIAGAGSALVWSFGPSIASAAGAVNVDDVGWLWIALGLGGLAGAATGWLVRRVSRRGAWLIWSGALAAANVCLATAAAGVLPWLALAGMAAFGAGYMGLTAVLILWARQAWPGGGGKGVSVLFIALAVGQALGSVGFGAFQGAFPLPACIIAAGLCVLAGLMELAAKSDVG